MMSSSVWAADHADQVLKLIYSNRAVKTNKRVTHKLQRLHILK